MQFLGSSREQFEGSATSPTMPEITKTVEAAWPPTRMEAVVHDGVCLIILFDA